MSSEALSQKVPSSAVPLAIAFAALTLVYSLVVRGSLTEWFAVMGSIVWLGLGVVVVYLLYRFVVAFEMIARKY